MITEFLKIVYVDIHIYMDNMTTIMAGKAHRDVQELIKALQIGGSRSKMEAAIAIRSLAASHNLHQVALIAAGGLRPLVDLLSYEAKEMQWPPDMRQKATITVRAEAALALASLSLSNDENKTAIGSTGAIPLLCDLIKFDEEETVRSNVTAMAKAPHKQQQSDPFLILARDAGVGALSCLAKNEANKSAIVRSNAVPNLVRMVDQGTAFGKAAAANVLAKLATGDNPRNKFLLGKEGAIPALLRLIQEGSSKARESAAEALTNLAMNSWNQAVIIKEGGVECLMKMVESSTPRERDAAVAALRLIQLPMSTSSLKIGHVEARGEARVRSLTAECHCKPITMNTVQEVVFKEGSARVASQNNQHKKLANIDTNASTNASSWGTKSSSTRSPQIMHSLFATELTSSMAPPLLGQPSIQADVTFEGHSQDIAAWQQQQQCCSRKRLKVSHIHGNNTSDKQYFPRFGQQRSCRNVCQAANEINPNSQIHCCLSNVEDNRLQSRFSFGNINAAVVGKETLTNFISNSQTLENNKIIGGACSKFASICKSKGEARVEADPPQHQQDLCSTPDSAFAGQGDPDFDTQFTMKKLIDPLMQSSQECSAEQSISNGISALVNALSSENIGAQEFASLALMLLASQGGNEVKTMIGDAGALCPLIMIVRSSSSPMTRESAASTIAKLVSCHPANRENLVRNQGVQALVEMAKWSTIFLDGRTPFNPEDQHKAGGESQEGNCSTLAARLQAAAIVAILSISDVLDKHSIGLNLRDALFSLVCMLESENQCEIEAGIGGLYALGSSLGMELWSTDNQFSEATSHFKGESASKSETYDQELCRPGVKAPKYGCIAAELVTSLLNLMRGSSTKAHKAAIEALAILRNNHDFDHHQAVVNVDAAESFEKASCKAFSDSKNMQSAALGDHFGGLFGSLIGVLRKEGLDALLLLFGKGANINASMREMVAEALACVIESEKLHKHLAEPLLVKQLMSLLRDESSTTMIKILAAAAIANFGSKRKRLSTIPADDFPVLLKLLLDNSAQDSASEDQNNLATAPSAPLHILDFDSPATRNDNPHIYSSSSSTGASCCCSSPPCHSYSQTLSQTPSKSQLLKEHVAAILVYSALAGEEQKQALIAAGAVPAFVKILQGSVIPNFHSNMLYTLPSFLQFIMPAQYMNNGVLLCPQATQEFAIMGLILLADKNVESMEKIVKAGGISILVKLLSNIHGWGRLGASWSEMAAVALLTLARCDSARDEIVRAGGVSAMVHVLKGDWMPSMFSLTGLAAMAQLLGILALNYSLETKIQLAKTGAVRCLVEILVGGGCLAWATEAAAASSCTREGLGLLALAQEAAAAALATVVLQCPENAEAAVEAGAIGPLVRLMGSHASCYAHALADQQEASLEPERDPENNSESGGSSTTTTVLTNDSIVHREHQIGCNVDTPAGCHSDGGDMCKNINDSLGPPLAALSALRNLIPCFPRSGQEIVNAGGSAKLISFLHAHGKKVGNLSFHEIDFKTKFGTLTQLSSHPFYPKLLENAALVLGLLAETNDDVREAVTSAGVLPILRDLFPSAKLATSVSSRSVTTEGQNKKEVDNTARS